MKIAPLAEVKSKLSEYLELCKTEPIIITRNGQASAMLVPYKEDDDLGSLLIANNKRFSRLIKDAEKRIAETGGLSHDEFWNRVDALYAKPKAAKRVSEGKALYRARRKGKKRK